MVKSKLNLDLNSVNLILIVIILCLVLYPCLKSIDNFGNSFSSKGFSQRWGCKRITHKNKKKQKKLQKQCMAAMLK